MNLDSLSAALSHIGYLVANLTKKNVNSSVQEIQEVVRLFGGEAERHLYRTAISQLELSGLSADSQRVSSTNSTTNNNNNSSTKQEKDTSPGGGATGTLVSASVVGALFQQLYAHHPTKFLTYLAQGIASNKSLKWQGLVGLCRTVRLTKAQEVLLGLHLLQTPNAEVRSLATTLLKARVPEVVRALTETDSGGSELVELSVENLHLLLSHILCSSSEQFGLNPEASKSFKFALQKEFPQSEVPTIFAPLLYAPSDVPMDKLVQESSSTMAKNLLSGSLPDLVLELGYGFCSSLEECTQNLASVGSSAVTAKSVARVLGIMVQTHTGLPSEQIGLQNLSSPSSLWGETKEKSVSGASSGSGGESGNSNSGPSGWNVEIFIKAILDFVPSLNGKEVFYELDHKGFFVKDWQSLKLLLTALRCLLQGQGVRADQFPVEFFYCQWANTEEQLNLVTQLVKCSDLFCFMDYQCRQVSTENLKTPPELDNKEIANWRSVQLIETLLNLGDNGGHYPSVKEIFKFPIQHCPDVLVLGLIQASTPFTRLRQELLASLIPIFLGNHPNAAIILHHAWHTQNNTNTVRQIIMHAMAEWYMMVENDQTRLSRILDVAQDLKALSLLLNAQPFPFVIDLACLAYRREFLKLDKWLTDKIREHGEAFISACVKFLQRRCPQLLGGKEELLPKSSQLPQETLVLILMCLQQCAQNMSQDLADTIMTMVQSCNMISRSRPQSGVIGFGPSVGQSENVGGISSSLANLNIGSGGGSSIFPPASSSMNLGALSSLGTAPGSPGRPLGPTSAPGTSQSPLSSILPSIQLPHHAVATQLPTLSTPSIMASPGVGGATMRPHSVQPTIGPARQMDMAQIFDMPPMVSKEVEDEANSYFQRIYNHPPHPTLSIEEVLEMLKKFHESGNKREEEVYSCMLRNLFEEYRFFPTYPDKELFTTARLFGGIIEQGLVEYMALGVALRYVMEALQKPHASKMYYFGIVALDRFRSRLREYPRYCQHLMAITHFNEFPQHLIEYIKYGTQSQEPPSRPSGVVLPPTLSTINVSPSTAGPPTTVTTAPPPVSSVAKTLAVTTTTTTTSTAVTRPPPPSAPATSGRPTMTTTNIETLLVATEKEEKINPPPDHMQEKIAFIFNNLSQVNLPQKCEELKEVVGEEYWVWVAQYLVMKRASIENNFHTLYSLFLDQLKMPNFNAMVTRETLRNIKVLLRSDKSIANFSDKSLLKNLGHWLGMLTLAKNKPILHVDIDMKSLLVEAYNNGLQEMQYVVPFVAKVLESCAKSRVFKPPNPWTMAIMNVLAELHKEPDMKLHLKFEIEVLCNKLELSVEDLKPGCILKDGTRRARLKPQLSQPGGGKRAESTPLFPALPVLQPGSFSSSTFIPPVDSSSSVPTSSAGATPTPPNVPPHPSTTPTPIHSLPQAASEPRFVYSDINVASLRGLDAHISVSVPQVGSIGTASQLKQLVRQAVESAVQDLVGLVMEKSIKIAIITAEHIIKKDFALDPDEARMRQATHHIVRNLTAAMAMITCRDHLALPIAKSIKQGLLVLFSRTSPQLPQQLEQVEQLATAIAQENVGIACAFIQKTAAEKAVIEMDKRLSSEYEARKQARAEGRRYYEPLVRTYQVERMPERIMLKLGGVTSQQMTVYEEFAGNIPGFLPVKEQDGLVLTKPVPVNSQPYCSDEGTTTFLMLTERISAELEHAIQTLTGVTPTSPMVQMLHALLEGLLLTRTSRDTHTVQLLLRKAVENLLEGTRDHSSEPELNHLALRFRDCHLIVLKAMADPRSYGIGWTAKQVTKCFAEAQDDIKYNPEVVDWLLRSNLMNLQMLDEHLAHVVEDPRTSYISTLFVMQLIQVYLIDDPSNTSINETDLQQTLEALLRLVHSRQAPDGLVSLLEALRVKHDLLAGERMANAGGTGNQFVAGPSLHFHSGVTQARDYQDPPALQEKTEMLLRDWIQMYHSPSAGQGSATAFQHFVKQMNLHGILKTDDLITRFFRICISMCRELCFRSIMEQSQGPSPTYVRNKCFHNLDAFVRLIALLVKHSGEASNPTTKINLLNKVLGLVCGIMIHDIETSSTDFQQLPYHRILIMLFLELNAPEAILESINFPVLMAFTQTLHLLRPSKCPGFAYAWLEIVSHRVFIGRMLAITPQQKGWSMYSMLLSDLFQFLAPFLRNAELAKPLTMLYKGTLRVLLVLLHDFPEFLCEYHYGFCDVIPPNCIQMRNLILSAFPRNMRLPDPFTPNLKVDMLPEISISPKIHINVSSLIQPPTFKKDLDSYLKNRTPVTFLSEMRTFLQVRKAQQVSNEPGIRYNLSVMNALVLYVGMQAIGHIHSKRLTPSMSTIAHSAHMDIFQNLAVDLDTEGRYLFLNAIANQLRYPNSHTHYFSCTLLYLFAEANTEAIQEQITRVLLERLIVNRPHPWGLLITFIELIKNPNFKFWSHEFVKCAPEIEKLFESVARSCMVQKVSGPREHEA